MSWAPGNTAEAWSPGNGEVSVLTLEHLGGGSISIQGQNHEFGAGLSFEHLPGSISLAGENHEFVAGLSLEHLAGSITIQGSAKWWFESPAWQYVTVADLSKIGTEPTLADAAVGYTVEIGDVWKAPTQSEDGGAVQVFADLTFTVGPPTSGSDVLPAVWAWDASLDEYHGPEDLSINNPPILEHTPGSIVLAGSNHEIVAGLSLEHLPGAIDLQGQNHEFGITGRLSLPHTPGSIVLTGQNHELVTGLVLEHLAGQITITGQLHEFITHLVLEHLAGAISIQGQDHDFVTLGSWAPEHLPGQIILQGSSHEFGLLVLGSLIPKGSELLIMSTHSDRVLTL